MFDKVDLSTFWRILLRYYLPFAASRLVSFVCSFAAVCNCIILCLLTIQMASNRPQPPANCL